MQQEQQLDIPDNISVIQHQQERRQAVETKAMHGFGGIHINYLLYFFIPLLISACIFSYHQAVSKKEEPPYPHATITNTACHYPQDIVFRYLMLSAGGFINLVYFCVFKWMALEQKRTGYPGDIHSWLLKLAQVSTLGFLAAIGTIDANGYPIIHDIGAVFFFIVLFLVAMVITLVLRDMHAWDPSTLSRNSYISKTGFALYLIGLVIYSVICLLLRLRQNDDDAIVVIIEWNLVYIGLSWLMTFAFDWQHVFITLKGDFSSAIKMK